MKRYQFRLERLLAVRKHHELEWELKLAAVTRECVRLRNEIEEADGARRAALAGRYAVAGLDLSYLTASELYMRRLDALERTDRRLLSEKERERDEVRTAYLAASRDRKVLDRLREKRRIAYRREQRTAEIVQVDDMSSSSNAWNNKHT